MLERASPTFDSRTPQVLSTETRTQSNPSKLDAFYIQGRFGM